MKKLNLTAKELVELKAKLAKLQNVAEALGKLHPEMEIHTIISVSLQNAAFHAPNTQNYSHDTECERILHVEEVLEALHAYENNYITGYFLSQYSMEITGIELSKEYDNNCKNYMGDAIDMEDDALSDEYYNYNLKTPDISNMQETEVYLDHLPKGTKVKITDAGRGALGVNGSIVTIIGNRNEGYFAQSGILDSDTIIVKLDTNGINWAVSRDAKGIVLE